MSPQKFPVTFTRGAASPHPAPADHSPMPLAPAPKPWPKLPPEFSFRMASNLAEDSAGRIYVVHRGARPLVRFDANGNFLDSIGDTFLLPSINYDLSKTPPSPIGWEHWLHGLHVDPWDNIWITDLGRHLVMKFDVKGRLLMTLGRPDLPGDEADRFNQPTAVAVGRSGHIYVADGYGNSRIVKYSADGRPLQAWGRKGSAPGEFQTPHGLALDEEENVYVAERLNHRIQVFGANGRALGLWSDFCRPDAIVVRGNEVFVGTGYGDNAVYRCDRDGRNRQVLGAGSDAFGYPHGIHLDRHGNLYVADPVAEKAAAHPAKFPAVVPSP